MYIKGCCVSLIFFSEIWGSHFGEGDSAVLLGYGARQIPAFQGEKLSLSSVEVVVLGSGEFMLGQKKGRNGQSELRVRMRCSAPI